MPNHHLLSLRICKYSELGLGTRAGNETQALQYGRDKVVLTPVGETLIHSLNLSKRRLTGISYCPSIAIDFGCCCFDLVWFLRCYCSLCVVWILGCLSGRNTIILSVFRPSGSSSTQLFPVLAFGLLTKLACVEKAALLPFPAPLPLLSLASPPLAKL